MFQIFWLLFPQLEFQISSTPVSITNCRRSQLEPQVLFTWPVAPSHSPLLRQWRCDTLALSHLDLVDALLRAVQHLRTQLSVCPTARTHEFITFLAPCNMLDVISHSNVHVRLVASGKLADRVHRLGAVLAERGLCPEIGQIPCCGFVRSCFARLSQSLLQVLKGPVLHSNTPRQYSLLRRLQRESEDQGPCVVTNG